MRERWVPSLEDPGLEPPCFDSHDEPVMLPPADSDAAKGWADLDSESLPIES